MYALLGEASTSQIDKDWIAGIRKSWKKWADRASSFEGYFVPATAMEYDLILKAADASKAYLDEGREFIRLLREDLMLNKGFWTRPSGDAATPAFAGMKGKAILLLREAEEAVSDGLSKVDFWRNQTHPEHGYRRDETWKDLASFNQILRTVSLAAEEAAGEADKILSGKLLRHLSTLTGKSGKSGGPLDFGGYEPTVLKLGDATVVFQDTTVDPARFAVAAADPDLMRHPTYRTDYVKHLKQAKALLDRRKLAFLWYGRFEVLASGLAPTNPNGAHFGTGAEYYRQGDYIRIYSDPKNLAKLIVHELGHRYFYKFLSATDRGKFNDWFGKVKATSAYGATSSIEDFAEVFSDYVMGTDMTRDQIDRFKTVLGRETRQESLSALVAQTRVLLTERAEAFGNKEVEKLRKDFLALMKNVDRVKNYAEADKLRAAFARWRGYYEETLYKQFIPKISDQIADKLHIDLATLWKPEFEPLKSELDHWIKYWDKKLREGTWPLSTEMSLPLDHVADSKWQHNKTMNADWYTSQGKEYDIPAEIFAQYLKVKDKWADRVKRKARPAWAVLQEYITWLGKPTTINITSDENIELEGFKFRILGGDNIQGDSFQDVLPKLRIALKRYRTRAMKVFPWVIDNQLRMELTFDCGLNWAGRYHRDHIEICVFAASSESAESIAHVLAHEMGHHVWKTYLSGEAQNFWSLAVKTDRGELDLVKLAALWEKEAPKGHLSDLEKVLQDDPVLYLQVQTLTHGHGQDQGKSVFFSLDDLKELITKGTVTYSVPNNPITAYASKNPEEAFCEAFGYLVAYGPRSVLPLVRSWLRTVLPESRTEDSLRDLTAWGRSLLNEAAEGDCFRFAYKRVQEGGTLIHATVVHPWSGKQFPHAWVEDGGKAYDWQTSQGLGKGKPLGVAAFRQQWKPAAETSYTADEAKVLAVKTKHFGPWAA